MKLYSDEYIDMDETSSDDSEKRYNTTYFKTKYNRHRVKYEHMKEDVEEKNKELEVMKLKFLQQDEVNKKF